MTFGYVSVSHLYTNVASFVSCLGIPIRTTPHGAECIEMDYVQSVHEWCKCALIGMCEVR